MSHSGVVQFEEVSMFALESSFCVIRPRVNIHGRIYGVVILIVSAREEANRRRLYAR